MTPPAAVGYARRIGLFSGTMMVVGGIIGGGIFLNPAVVAQRVGSAGLTLTVWGLGALVAILGAFIFAELGARAPAAGGGYVYLRDAFGPLPAFLYGWALLLAISTGATAAVAVTFARYATPLLGWTVEAQLPLAAGTIITFAVINGFGVSPGAWVQNLFTLLKLGAIIVLIVAGLTAESAPLSATVALPSAPNGFLPVGLALGTALVPVLFSYGGWQQTNFVAEEMVDAERNLPRALVIGVLIVAAVYLLVNVTYLRTLGIGGLAASTAPAADAMAVRYGEGGRRLIAAGIAISTAGFLHLVTLATPRVYQAMARDGVFFRGLAALHPRTQAPVRAIVLQAAWSLVLVFSGSYGELLDWVTFADWIFFGATAATLFVYRRRRSMASTRAPWHPISTGLFLTAAVYVVLGAIASNPGNALRGTLLLLSGVPVFLYWRRSQGRGDTSMSPRP